MQAAATARGLWRSMQADGVQPNGMAIAAYLEILLLEGEIDEALQVGGLKWLSLERTLLAAAAAWCCISLSSPEPHTPFPRLAAADAGGGAARQRRPARRRKMGHADGVAAQGGPPGGGCRPVR